MNRREQEEDVGNVGSEYENVRQKMGNVKTVGLREVNTARMVKLNNKKVSSKRKLIQQISYMFLKHFFFHVFVVTLENSLNYLNFDSGKHSSTL
jgi:hypothetical protein